MQILSFILVKHIGLYQILSDDVRFKEGMKACMNCGVCTAICPAAEFHEYDPRLILNIIQSKDEEQIEQLLKSETIWYCGQCMSCKSRCPRGNVPGMLINVLRKVSQELGFFTETKKGRQQYAVLKTVGENILNYGYCVHPEVLKPDMHPEQGPVWEWVHKNRKEAYARLGADLEKQGAGTLRKITKETLDELKSIFDVTGGTEFYKHIETCSRKKAEELGFDPDKDMDGYFDMVYRD